MSKKLHKIWNIVSTVIVVLVVAFAVLSVGVRVVGIKTYAVISGSMEPEYPVGSLLWVRSVDPAELKVGDAITFLISEDTAVTHRIVEIVPDESDPSVLRFYTKGDANETNDGGDPVHEKNIIGKPIFAIPLLGYAAYFIQNPPGLYLAIGAVAILLVLTFLPDLLKEKPKKSEVGRSDGEKTDDKADP